MKIKVSEGGTIPSTKIVGMKGFILGFLALLKG